MCYFSRITKCGAFAIHSILQRGIGKLYSKTDAGKEIIVKRVVCVNQEGFIDSKGFQKFPLVPL